MTGQPEPGGYTSGNVLYCQYGCGPATVLVIINETPGILCCDNCACRYCGMDPYRVRLAPLAGYVDLYAAAKEAALALLEQVTAGRSTAISPGARGAVNPTWLRPVSASTECAGTHHATHVRVSGRWPLEARCRSGRWMTSQWSCTGGHMPAKQTTAMLGQQRQQQARWGRAAPVPARSHASSVHRDPVSDIHGNVTYRQRPWE